MRNAAILLALIAVSALAGAERSAMFEAYEDGSALLVARLDGCDSDAVYYQKTVFTDDGIEVTKRARFATTTPALPKAVIIPSGGVAESSFEFSEGRVTARSFALTGDDNFEELQLKPFSELPRPESIELDVDCEVRQAVTITMRFPERTYDFSGLLSFAWLSITHLDTTETTLKRQFLYDESDLPGYFSLLLEKEGDPSPLPGLQQPQVPLDSVTVRLPGHLLLERANIEHSRAEGKTYYWDDVTNLAVTMNRDFGDLFDPDNMLLLGGTFALVVLLVFIITQFVMKPLATLKVESEDKKPEEEDVLEKKAEPGEEGEAPETEEEETLKALEELEKGAGSGEGEDDEEVPKTGP